MSAVKSALIPIRMPPQPGTAVKEPARSIVSRMYLRFSTARSLMDTTVAFFIFMTIGVRAPVVKYFTTQRGFFVLMRSLGPRGSIIEGVNKLKSGPLPSGRGRRDSLRAGAPGEGRAKREPDRAKPQEKSIRILRPSPCRLPEGEGDSFAIHSLYTFALRIKEAPSPLPRGYILDESIRPLARGRALGYSQQD